MAKKPETKPETPAVEATADIAAAAAAAGPETGAAQAGPTVEKMPEPMPAVAVKAIHPNRVTTAETARNLWCVYPTAGTPFEALQDPAYWSHIASKLRITDRIEVYPEDSSYFAELLVRQIGRQSATVGVLRHVALGEVPLQAANDFSVQYAGPVNKHSVIRLKDRKIMQNGFDTSDAAMAWLGKNSKSLVA